MLQIKHTIVGNQVLKTNSLKKAMQRALKNKTDIIQEFDSRIIFNKGWKVKQIKYVRYLIKDWDGVKILQMRYPINEQKMRPLKNLHYIVLHHFSGSLPELLNVHLKRFPAIGFHYLITKEGVIIQTRDHKFEGDHTKDQNSKKIAICFLDDFNKHKPNKAMLSAYKKLLKLIKSYHIIRKEFGHGELTILKVNWMLREKGIPYQIEHEKLFKSRSIKMFENKIKKEINILKKMKVPKKILYELVHTTTCPGIHMFKLMDF